MIPSEENMETFGLTIFMITSLSFVRGSLWKAGTGHTDISAKMFNANELENTTGLPMCTCQIISEYREWWSIKLFTKTLSHDNN